jgi:hypothetical protein
MLPSIKLPNFAELSKEDPLALYTAQVEPQPGFREDIGEYVAQLQLHMALQARNLVPNITQTHDSREQFLHETQATIEKLVSRQVF